MTRIWPEIRFWTKSLSKFIHQFCSFVLHFASKWLKGAKNDSIHNLKSRVFLSFVRDFVTVKLNCSVLIPLYFLKWYQIEDFSPKMHVVLYFLSSELSLKFPLCRYLIQHGAFETLVQVTLAKRVDFVGQPLFFNIFLNIFWNILKNWHYQWNSHEKWWL